MNINNEKSAQYKVTPVQFDVNLIKRALENIELVFSREEVFCSPGVVADYLKLKLATLDNEQFGVLWLDTQNRLIRDEILFVGTIDAATVYPREVIKAALSANAARCILYHNHPSGIPTPSDADMLITQRLQDSLGAIEVLVIDHIIVGGHLSHSFAEHRQL